MLKKKTNTLWILQRNIWVEERCQNEIKQEWALCYENISIGILIYIK
jgi:hypothetical protein